MMRYGMDPLSSSAGGLDLGFAERPV